jgi:hypothetical protein
MRVIQKLEPPPEIKYKIRKMDEAKLPKNWFLRFIKIFFFGDGY